MNAIAAMSLNRVIGNKGKIPWHISEDLKFFRKMTIGGNLLMGRKTYESVGTLPGRVAYVLTGDKDKLELPWTSVCRYVDLSKEDLSFVDARWPKDNPLWLCGGAKTYEMFMPLCDEVYLTIVLDEYEGDAYMPAFEHMFPNSEIIRESKQYWIVRYWK